jgi:outer membrane protein assembly factor BamB
MNFLRSLLMLTLAAVLPAKAAVFAGQPSGRILAAGDQRVLILSPDGEIVWQYPTKLTHDAWMLPSGNVLFADGESVTEVTADKKVVFQYRAEQQKGGGTYACQRLADSRTLAGENSTGRVLELDAAGKIVFALQTSPCEVGAHHNMRMARKLGNGNYLVCHSGARCVKEYDPNGKAVWEVKVPGALAFAAVRTSGGTTLVSCLDRVIEYDAAGRTLWECLAADLPGGPVRNLTGLHLLPNGHVVLGCYRAYEAGQGAALLEISREKQVTWRYSNPSADATMMAVELLSPEGKPLPGPARR